MVQLLYGKHFAGREPPLNAMPAGERAGILGDSANSCYSLGMDKRLAKRHKRQVARAKEHVTLSEPDVRTPEQIKAAREASRAALSRKLDGGVSNPAASFRNSKAPGTGSAAKTDA